jgi:cytochrome c-type biogenesis protein CcmH/NrfF
VRHERKVAARSVTRRLVLVSVLVSGLLSVWAPAALAAQPKVSLTGIESQFMCTSCHEPLPLAQSPQAQSEKQFLAGLVNHGLTAGQIRAQMVANYGVAVLGQPPAQGFNLTVYILPPVLVLLGVGGLLYTLPKWRARSRRAAAERPQGAPPLEPGEAERLDQDLARFI